MKKRKKEKSRFNKNVKFNQIVFSFSKIIIWLCILYNIVFVIQNTIYKKDYLKIFNIIVFVQKDKSMQGEISKNSIIVMKKIDIDCIAENMIIGYNWEDSIKVSKVIQIDIENGKKELITKDSENYYPNIEKISDSYITWKLIKSIRGFGWILKILQSKIITFFIFIFLIIKFLFNIDKYSKQGLRETKLYYSLHNDREIDKKKLD